MSAGYGAALLARPRRARDGIVGDVRTLVAHRELLRAWTTREITVRYKQAILGAAWAVVQPVSMMLLFSVIFTHFVPVPTDGIPYPIFSFSALLPWLLSSTAITTGAISVINNMALVTKVKFPREILPLAHVGAAGFDFAVASVLFIGMLVVYQVPLTWSLLAVPGLLLIQVTLTCGLVLLASAATVRYRDVRFVVPLALQLWMYATPIIYPLSVVPASWRWVLRANPMTVVIEGYRGAILYARFPAWQDLALASAVAALALGVGYVYFKRTEVWFADII